MHKFLRKILFKKYNLLSRSLRQTPDVLPFRLWSKTGTMIPPTFLVFSIIPVKVQRVSDHVSFSFIVSAFSPSWNSGGRSGHFYKYKWRLTPGIKVHMIRGGFKGFPSFHQQDYLCCICVFTVLKFRGKKWKFNK